jgi:hypothetical protein
VVQARTCGEWLQLRVLLPDGSGGGSSSRWKEARNVCCRLPGNRVQLLQACEKSGVVLFVAGDGRLCLYSVDIEMVVPQVRLVLDGLPDGVRWPGRLLRVRDALGGLPGVPRQRRWQIEEVLLRA